MRKIIYILFLSIVFFSCEDNFDIFYKGDGIISIDKYNCSLIFENEEINKILEYNNPDDYSSKYNISVNDITNDVIFNLPHSNIEIKGYIQSSVDWEFNSIPDWITISQIKGSPRIYESEESGNIYYNDTITFYIDLNNSFSTPRSDVIFLKGTENEWEKTFSLSFNQDAFFPSAYINEEKVEFKGYSSIDTIVVKANCPFSTFCSDNWFSVKEIITNDTTYNAQIVIQTTEFPTETSYEDYRYGYLDLYYTKEESNIIDLEHLTIYQYPHSITTEQESYTVTNVAQSIPLSFEAEADWTASSTVSWISTSVAQGSKGKNTININIEQLPSGTYQRSGAIELKLFNKTKLTISIEQVNVN